MLNYLADVPVPEELPVSASMYHTSQLARLQNEEGGASDKLN